MERVVLIAAGLDPSGGAGLLADVATAAARGVRAAGVATALTVQDSVSCASVEVAPIEVVRAQLASLVADLDVAAVKVGMLGSAEMARVVAEALRPLVLRGVPLVLDPVLRATVGPVLLDGDVHGALAPWREIATLVTPNREEAGRLAGVAVEDRAGQLAAARELVARGWRAALIKGGHFEGDEVRDLLVDGEGVLELAGARAAGVVPHGTGCALSTEIACALALGASLREAVAEGRARVVARIAGAQVVGHGRPFLGRR